jgi:ribosomal protein L11 methyltransferase
MTDEIQSLINQIMHSSTSVQPSITIRRIEDQNWNEAWEKTIKPIHVTDRIVIKPTWHEYSPVPDELVITIDPKMSFGTGYHETTRLVLRLMERFVRPGMSILDVGTGTGVLAITGIRLGARNAVGIDVDEWSSTNAQENVRLNRVENQVTIRQTELACLPPMTFDLITANIQLNAIVSMLTQMGKRLAGGGVLLLSGLLANDNDEIMGSLSQNGFTMCEKIRENEWIALAATLSRN